MQMSKSGHAASIGDLLILGLIIFLVWFALYLLGLALVRMIKRDKSPFLKSLISLPTFGFLLFSLAFIGFVCFQFYKSSNS
jgi:hypothetical protein